MYCFSGFTLLQEYDNTAETLVSSLNIVPGEDDDLDIGKEIFQVYF